MTAKNRSRLRVLQDDRQQQGLLHLPERLAKRALQASRGIKNALLLGDALAIAILLTCPVRIKNLAGIHLNHNLHRPRDGRAYLAFLEEETKTGRPIEFELPLDTLKMMDQYLARRSPEICPPGTRWLFPRRDGTGPLDPSQLASRITRRIRRETGLEMNVHLFRHFAVMLWLDANPGSYEAARRLLGHSEVSHTINMYSGLERQAAIRAFSDLVTTKQKALMRLAIRLDDWPAEDMAMWQSLTRSGNPLDEEGRFAHLRETSKATLCRHYGRWLAWLVDAEPEALRDAPAARCTIERLMRWRDTMSEMRPMSRLCLVGDTLHMLMVANPEGDWTRHRQLKRHLKRAAGLGDPTRKSGRILSSAVLFEAGRDHATVDVETATTELEAMKRQRNGTMVAMLALMPMRRRAFAHLEIGTSLFISEDRTVVALPDELTKNGLPWEAEAPKAVEPLLRRYIEEVRPWFMARGNQRHSFLWVKLRGTPFDVGNFGNQIGDITLQLTGVRVPPHFFRDAAATTLSRLSPDAARLIRPILPHTSAGTAERHYIHAQTIDAGRDYAKLIKRMKGPSS
jgi:integrase